MDRDKLLIIVIILFHNSRFYREYHVIFSTVYTDDILLTQNYEKRVGKSHGIKPHGSRTLLNIIFGSVSKEIFAFFEETIKI